MIAVDTSALVSYFSGETGQDIVALDDALQRGSLAFPPVVLTEILCARGMTATLRRALVAIPLLAPTDGFWERAGMLRASLLRRRLRARLADSLIAQTCIDHDASLITRDVDFRHFAKHAGLRLIAR